jgi:hypothetical protein
MPRFFFSVSANTDDSVEDLDGTELPDLASATSEAAGLALAVAKDRLFEAGSVKVVVTQIAAVPPTFVTVTLAITGPR